MDIARKTALEILYEIDTNNAYSNIILNAYLNKNKEKLNNNDINLISEIIYGTITWKLTIDVIIEKYSKIKIKKMSPWVKNLLRMGTYQIIFLDKIPKSAAVNETVELSKKYAHKSSSFINAILRKIEKKDYEEITKIKDYKERISKMYSMPEWLIEELMSEYTNDEIEQIAKYSNTKPKITIRINSIKTNKEEFIKKLQERNISYEETSMPYFIHIKNVKNISKIDLFEQGLFTVQDIGAGNISKMLAPKSKETVLDICSAPGGKTTHMAEIMKNSGTIIACDIYKHRLKLVEENYKRLGINIIETKQMDATILEKEFIGKFDKILLDVPCLGIGVMKRKPDIKWQRKKEDIEEITQIQEKILTTSLNYLKENGELVYSTCSILKKENEDLVNKTLNKINEKQKLQFELVEKKKILPNENTDGFFFCKIKKK